MKIILMRHGKPVLAQWGRIAPVEMGRWIEQYNFSEVQQHGIPVASRKQANSATVVVASTASRSISSVQALGLTPTIVDATFCEAQLPYALWLFPRLSPVVWAAIFRLAWMFGYSRGSDSIHATRIRAKTAAQKLISLANTETVLLVGHGIMNRLIARELIAIGWIGAAKHESKYWSTSIYGVQT